MQQVPIHLPVAVHIPSNPARAQRVHRGGRGRVRAVGDDGADRPAPGRRQRRRVRVGPRHEGEAQLGAGEEIYCEKMFCEKLYSILKALVLYGEENLLGESLKVTYALF